MDFLLFLERAFSFPAFKQGQPMRIEFKADAYPDISSDEEAVTVTFRLPARVVVDQSATANEIAVELDRKTVYWLWANLDASLIQELRAVERDASIDTPRLDEVRRVLEQRMREDGEH